MSRAKSRLNASRETKDSVTLLPCFYFVELPILVSSVISLYFLELTDIFQPVHSGYSCNDRSLSLPYVLPRLEVCPLPLLFSLAFTAPAATILIGEAILYCYFSRRSSATQTEADISAAGCNFNSYIRRTVRFIGVHIFGLSVTALITDILQLSTGQHTPFWLDVCKPNLTYINMSTCDEAYILEDICSGPDARLINDGRKSFPSQHATLAAFAAVYISMYFNTMLTHSAKLLKPLLVFSFVMLAVLVGLTRIIQFRNHPVDVYCGWGLGAAIAIYLGVYAVGNFQPSEDDSRGPPLPPILREPPLSSLANVSHSALSNSHQGHHTLAPSHQESVIARTSSHALSSGQSGPIMTLSASYREPSMSNLKRASTEVEVLNPASPSGNRDSAVMFSSSTLPRSHGASSLDEVRNSRRHNAIHASMDSTRSKQLLSQWKNKNDNRKLSLQMMDGIRSVSLSSPQRNMEARCSSEQPAAGPESEPGGGHISKSPAQEVEMCAGTHIPAQYIKLAAVANNNHLALNGSNGMVPGARVSVQSRPGSSQLVHIPEEENPASRDQESESEESVVDGGGSVREKWLRVAEKSSLPCRPLSAGGQPRLMQVIAFSKQQGMLHSPRSEDSGSTVSCSGSIRYRALTDQDTSPPASTTGAVGGRGLIVRVDAHPESRHNKPEVKPPSTDGSGSWRWKPPELRSGNAVRWGRRWTGGGEVYNSHPHVVHPLHPLHPNNPNYNPNNPNYNPSNPNNPNNPNYNNVHPNNPNNPNYPNYNPNNPNNYQHPAFHPNNPSNPNYNPNNPGNPNYNPNNPSNPSYNNVHPNNPSNPNYNNVSNPNYTNVHPNFNPNNVHPNFNPSSSLPFSPFPPPPQALTTIRVTPVEGTTSDGGSDCPSSASSSRESTLRKKGSAGDQGPPPDPHRAPGPGEDQERNSRFHDNLRSFQENPNHQQSYRQMQSVFAHPNPPPPPHPTPPCPHPQPTLQSRAGL
ncbi:unnamed protein product [Menidia menidia]|uniref:Phospholipid phosphatase-related protein type 3 n=1 Tax=Menidia menidia TaxID=238744 RepID=A0A8S4AKK1_9TELE|nr:unnamed protein product [Menidia menidia]